MKNNSYFLKKMKSESEFEYIVIKMSLFDIDEKTQSKLKIEEERKWVFRHSHTSAIRGTSENVKIAKDLGFFLAHQKVKTKNVYVIYKFSDQKDFEDNSHYEAVTVINHT